MPLASAIARQSPGRGSSARRCRDSVSPSRVHVAVRAVGRAQVELRELLVERLVLAQRQRQRRAQRHALGAEERELLA